MSEKKQTRLEYILAAVDKFSAPMRRFNKRVSESTKGIRQIRKASANLKQESGWNKLAYRVGVLKKRIGSVAREIKALAVRFVAATAAAAGGLLAIVNSTATAGDHIAKTSRKLGLSTTALQELTYAAERGGVEVSTFEMAFQRFGRRAGEAFMGKGEAVTALKQLGINLKDSSGKMRGVDSLFMDVAESLSRIENPAIRNALAMKLFDSEGVKLVQMLDGGREGLAAMRREAHRYGNVLSGPTTKASEAYMDTMTNLKAAFAGAKNVIGEELMPTVAYLAQKLTTFFVEHQAEIREWVHGVAVELPGAFKKLKEAVGELLVKLAPFFSFVGRLADVFGGVNMVLAALAAIILGPLVSAVVALVPALMTLGTALGAFAIKITIVLIPAIVSLGTALLTTPIGWFIAIVAVLVGLAVLIIRKWTPISEFFKNLWGGIVNTFRGAMDWIEKKLKAVIDWLPDWMTGKKKIEVKVNRTEGDDASVRTGRPTVGAGRMMRNRYGRQGIVDRQERETTVKVKFEDVPRGTRVTQKGDAPVDMSMGYAMTMP